VLCVCSHSTPEPKMVTLGEHTTSSDFVPDGICRGLPSVCIRIMNPFRGDEHLLADAALPLAQEMETFARVYHHAMATRALRYDHEMLSTLWHSHIIHTSAPPSASRLRLLDRPCYDRR
jgi:hypothetical protein